jgi:hypothetical protein
MLRFVLFVIASLACACGGQTTSGAGPDGDAASSADNICGAFADSGLTLLQCVATHCCDPLTACADNADGIAYEECVANCFFDGGIPLPDGGGPCQDSCSAAHAGGAAACQPYLACATQSCAPSH